MIRPAHREELAMLSALAMRSKAVWGYSTAFMEACRAELTLDADDLLGTFVKQVAQGIAGFYSVSKYDGPLPPALPPIPRAELDFLFVEPWALRRGYGRQLLDHARAQAHELGCSALLIQGDPNAAAFYRSAGARQIGERASSSIPGRMLPYYELRVSAD